MSREPASYVCPSCGARSYNANDLLHRYCGRCHLFEDDDPMPSLAAPTNRCRRPAGSQLNATRAEEFDCIECRRHIVRMVPMPELGHLCGTCLHSPGWYRIPELRRIIDPDMTVPEV